MSGLAIVDEKDSEFVNPGAGIWKGISVER